MNGIADGSRPVRAGACTSPQAWLLARARLLPVNRELRVANPAVASILDHDWAPMQALLRQVRCLSGPLLDYLRGCAGGYVAVGAEESRYVPGPAMLRRRAVTNVAYVSVWDLAEDNERPLHVIGRLIDHHLGTGGEGDGPWLTEGGGVSATWRAAGARLQRLWHLGLGVDGVARAGPQDYFAQSLAVYCRDRRALNVADPGVYKWFRSTLWSAAFWNQTK